MPVPKLQSLMFPVKGLVENTAESAQPPLTTRDCLNVRAYDSLERRNRGGQRTGISKYFAASVSGSNPIQAIGSAVQAFDPSALIADTQLLSVDFTAMTTGRLTTLDPTTWPSDYNTGTVANSNTGFSTTPATSPFPSVITADSVNALGLSGAGSNLGRGVLAKALSVGASYLIRATVRLAWHDSLAGLSIVFRVDPAVEDYYVLHLFHTSEAGTGGGQVYRVNGSGADDNLATLASYTTTRTALNDFTDPFTVELQVNGNIVNVRIGANTVVQALDIGSTYVGQSRLAFSVYDATSVVSDGVFNSISVFTGAQPASLRTTKLIAVSGGTVKVGTPDDGLTTAVNGSSALKTDDRIAIQGAFQKVFFADGITGNYQYLDLSSNTLKDWATDVTGGSLPQGSVDTDKACRIAVLYRGRIVMAGLQEEPQNWFMSKSGDPFDWDYSPATTTPIQAVAGNNSDAGELGDVVTALAPYQDDVMVLGGANSIWVMRGDPAAGGAIDNITRQIGIVGPDAWTWDTGNTFYFFGENGLYRMSADSGTPELLSRGRLDKTLADIDIAANHIRLVYDVVWQGVHIFVSPAAQPGTASFHYFWDERNNAFFKDQYPASVGPTAVLRFNADTPDDSGVLLGGYDSYIRIFDDAAKNDDGTAINSHVLLPPIQPGAQYASARIDDVNIVMGKGGDDVLLEAYAASTPEEANDAAIAGTAPRFSRTLGAGRNSYLRQRVAQNAVVLRLEQTATQGTSTTWAFEQGGAKISVLDRMRGRRV